MKRYLVTHSLLASWLYAMKSNPYEDMTTERNPMEELMLTLRREPTPTTEAMQNGIAFEDMVTDIMAGRFDLAAKWHAAAAEVADYCTGGVLQFKVKQETEVAGIPILLYGRLDCLKAGEVIDIKFSKSYDRGKYITSTQHPTYLELVPEAHSFTYLVSNGTEVWRETYRRDETPSIFPTIHMFFDWLQTSGHMELYKQHWGAK